MCIESVMPSNHLILCHPLLLPPSVFPSIKVFSNESVLHIRWPKYPSWSLSISPSSEYSGLISFRIDWFDLLLLEVSIQEWYAKSLQSCPTLCDPIDGSHQAPPSLGFSRQEHWSGLPSPSPMHQSESEVTQSCPTLRDPMGCSPPGSSVHRILQARALGRPDFHCSYLKL